MSDGIEAPSASDGIEALSVSDGIEALSVSDGIEALSVSDGIEAPSVSDGIEALSVSDGIRPNTLRSALERAHSAGISFGQAASSLARDGISSRVPGARETRGSITRFHAKSARYNRPSP